MSTGERQTDGGTDPVGDLVGVDRADRVQVDHRTDRDAGVAEQFDPGVTGQCPVAVDAGDREVAVGGARVEVDDQGGLLLAGGVVAGQQLERPCRVGQDPQRGGPALLQRVQIAVGGEDGGELVQRRIEGDRVGDVEPAGQVPAGPGLQARVPQRDVAVGPGLESPAPGLLRGRRARSARAAAAAPGPAAGSPAGA